MIRTFLANTVAASEIWHPRLRVFLLRRLGMKVGARSRVSAKCRVIGDVRNVQIGEDAFLNREVLIDADGGVRLGNRVSVGPRAMIITGTHDIGPSHWRAQEGVSHHRSCSVGSGTWLGAGVIVLPGVEIGHGVVVAAGSTVTRGVDADTLVAGVPARAVRSLG